MESFFSKNIKKTNVKVLRNYTNKNIKVKYNILVLLTFDQVILTLSNVKI